MMNASETSSTATRARMIILAAGLLLAVLPLTGFAQPPVDVPDNAAVPGDAEGEVVQSGSDPVVPSLWDLAVQGGWFMIPIGIASIVTIAFTLERLVGLRRIRILPRELIHKLREFTSDSNLDPRKLWEAAEQHRSPLANVLKAAILKAGRPQAEVENSVEDAVQRETGDMTRNLRPINVVASIAPLLGLLGTVQGMILAFMVTSTTTSTGTAKAQELAHGIYTALVTTFAGLTVAVVSVVLANFLEGRIERLLEQMEAIFLDLLPQLERYEGRLRISESTADGEGIRIRQVLPAVTATATPTPQQKQTAAKVATDRSASRPLPTRKLQGQKPAERQEKEGSKGESGPASAEKKAAVAVPVSSPSANTLRAHFDA